MRSALAEARSVDEVKDIRDKSEAMRAYARMAKDTQLEIDATELRLRAERRLGIMLDAEKQAGRLGPGQPKKNGNEDEPFSRVTLEQIGIDKQLSARSQKIAGIGERDRIAKGDRVALDVVAVASTPACRQRVANRGTRGEGGSGRNMKLAEARPYAEPEAAARKLLELAAGVQAINDRIHIEKINGPFLSKTGCNASGPEFGAGIKYAVDQGWLELHESGTYVRVLAPGADPFPRR